MTRWNLLLLNYEVLALMSTSNCGSSNFYMMTMLKAFTEVELSEHDVLAEI